MTDHWTQSLFAAAGMGAAPFEVEDFRNLADWADPTAEDVVVAEHAAELVAGLAWRAPCEAIRRAEYARTLAARHSARVRRAAGSASP